MYPGIVLKNSVLGERLLHVGKFKTRKWSFTNSDSRLWNWCVVMHGFLGCLLGNRGLTGPLQALGRVPGGAGVLRMSTAPALVHRALVVREARMEDAETRRCYGSRVLAAVGTGAGVSLTSLSELRKRKRGELPRPSLWPQPLHLTQAGGDTKGEREGWCGDIYGGREGTGIKRLGQPGGKVVRREGRVFLLASEPFEYGLHGACGEVWQHLAWLCTRETPLSVP